MIYSTLERIAADVVVVKKFDQLKQIFSQEVPLCHSVEQKKKIC